MRIADELAGKPFDREQLNRLAEVAVGRICDLGCGPGHIAAYLRERGAAVLGIDISAGMVAQARQRYPDIEFRQGKMAALDVADDSGGGIFDKSLSRG